MHCGISLVAIPAALSMLMGNFYAFNDYYWLKFTPAGTLLNAAILAVLFRRGKWKEFKV